jgi:hypothetical protein
VISELARELAASVARELAASAGLDAEEVLDALWLSAARPRHPAELTSPNSATSRPPVEVKTQSDDEPAPDLDSPAPVSIYSDSWPEADGDAAPTTAVGFEAPRPRQRIATPPMAVRRLRKVVAPGRQLMVDIDATVDATAEARQLITGPVRPLLMPVLTRPPQPALDLAFVVDDSPSMSIWDEEFDDLVRLLARTHAFRSASRWRFTASEGAIRPYTRRPRGDQAPALPPQRPEQLINSSGQRLVFVATDARDKSWYGETPWDAINTWCSAMPTVLIQVLPSQYWPDTAVGTPYTTSRALTPAAPNSQYEHHFAWWTADDAPAGSPLPVVTLTEESLDTWARSIVNGTAQASGITATKPDLDSAPPTASEIDVDTAVNGFLAKATPGALRLARVLASTGTSLPMPLISVLRERLAPKTGVAELAEIMACGLLEDAGATDSGGQQVLRFRAGTREILYRGTTVFEDWDAFAVVGKYLEDRPRTGGPFQVQVADPTGSAKRDADDKPVYDVQYELAVRLGLPSPALPQGAAVAVLPFDGPRQPEGPEGLKRPGDRMGDSAALRDALIAEISQLGDSDEVKVAVFGTGGIAVWRVARDENGTPQAWPQVLTTAPVAAAAEGFYAQRLAPSIGDSRLLIAVGRLDESQAAVLSLLRAADDAPAFDFDGPFDDLLRDVIRSTPLTRCYDLIVLSETADGQLMMDSQPLFEPGAASGQRAEPFTVQCAPTDDRGTVFAVVARGSGTEPFLPDRLHPVQVHSAVVPPGTYPVTALLSRPGRVQFAGLPVHLSAEDRSLTQLIRRVPRRLRKPAPVHLVCLIEVSGGDARLQRRVDCLVQLIAAADDGERPLAVSVMSYGPHSVERGVQDEAATLLAQATSASRAVRVLRGILGLNVPARAYERAAQTECTLWELSNLLSRRGGRDGRPVVVTAGGRPPHPPRVDLRSEIIPCPNRVDWREVLSQLRQLPTISFGALCDPDAVGEIWRDLGRDAYGRLDREDIILGFARDLGLFEGTQVVPFPLLDPAQHGTPRPETPADAERPSARTFAATRLSISTVAAQLVALGPPGSGKTTFLSALDIALKRQPYGLTLVGADEPSVRLLISMTDALVTRHEFPQATEGIEYYEWTLFGSPFSTPRLTQGGTMEGAKSARPLQVTLGFADPSGEIVARTAPRYPDQPHHPDRQQLIQHVAGAEAILIMFDPIRELEHRDAFSTMDDFLRRVMWEVGASGYSRLQHHVAVCVTKFDDARVLDAATGLNLVTTDPYDPFGFPRVQDNDARTFFARLGGMHGRTDGERLLALLDQTFYPERVQFFVASAIGFYVDPRTSRFDPDDPQNVFPSSGQTRIRGAIRPVNIVEPILWLADRIAGT